MAYTAQNGSKRMENIPQEDRSSRREEGNFQCETTTSDRSSSRLTGQKGAWTRCPIEVEKMCASFWTDVLESIPFSNNIIGAVVWTKPLQDILKMKGRMMKI
jgi:hypothetical protein